MRLQQRILQFLLEPLLIQILTEFHSRRLLRSHAFFDLFVSGLTSFGFDTPVVGLPFGVATDTGGVTFLSLSPVLFTAQEQEQEHEIWVVVVFGR